MSTKRTNIIPFPKSTHPIPVIADAVNLIEESSEYITNYNMAHMVAAYIQNQCKTDLKLAENVLNPKKNFKNCISYIRNNAEVFSSKQLENSKGVAIPRELVYEWSVAYYNEMESEEDRKPKQSTKKAKADKSVTAKDKKPAKDDDQMSLFNELEKSV